MSNIFSLRYFPLWTSALLVLVLLSLPLITLAAPSISTSDTTSNVSTGTDDQDVATAATTANVEEVKATRTLTVGAAPVDAETITIGTCTVTFATTTAGSPTEDANCTGGATILTTTGTADDIARTAGEIATALRTLTNVSDTGHGALTIGGSGADVIATTTGTESSATAITFTDGTSGDITSTASTVGVVPVAQVNTITISGTVETDDVFTATLPTVGAVTYTVTASDTTASDIATGLNTAIQASAGYASQDFTSAASTNTVVLTAKVAGTGFTQTSSDTNRSAVAQVTVFTPTSVKDGHAYVITINDANYVFEPDSGATVQSVVEGLQPLVDADSAVTCTENDAAVTCTATSAGTAFTYFAKTSPSGSGISGGGTYYGCKDQSASNYEYFAAHKQSLCKYGVTPVTTSTADVPSTVPSLTAPTVGAVSGQVRDLMRGTYGEAVRMLQQLLNSQGFVLTTSGEGSPGNETTFFGPLTQNALAAYQSAHSISPAAGYFGPITRDQMKNAGLEGLWW